MNSAIPPAVERLLKPELFEFATEARKHFEPNDLVVIVDATGENVEYDAHPRAAMLQADGLGPVRDKIINPAWEAGGRILSPAGSFWLLAFHDGGATCVALNPSMLAPGGTA